MKLPESIIIDGTFGGEAPESKNRYLIVVDGKQVWLTSKSFTYLAKLADHYIRPNGAGWMYKDDIEIGSSQARYLYRLKLELQSQLGSLDWNIIDNNRLGYYRLSRAIKVVTINRANLVNHPDYDLRSLATV